MQVVVGQQVGAEAASEKIRLLPCHPRHSQNGLSCFMQRWRILATVTEIQRGVTQVWVHLAKPAHIAEHSSFMLINSVQGVRQGPKEIGYHKVVPRRKL